jgi:hypothetical protein
METVIDVEAMVMQRFPVLEEEANCWTSRTLRNAARHDYRLKLLKQQRESNEQKEIQPNERPQGT